MKSVWKSQLFVLFIVLQPLPFYLFKQYFRVQDITTAVITVYLKTVWLPFSHDISSKSSAPKILLSEKDYLICSDIDEISNNNKKSSSRPYWNIYWDSSIVFMQMSILPKFINLFKNHEQIVHIDGGNWIWWNFSLNSNNAA